MALLGAKAYDPGTAATAATTSLLAMTAFDTTNLRITFTAPANGIVLARIRVAQKGATSNPTTLLGILDGATVKGRQSPLQGRQSGSAGLAIHEASFLVTGLTPSSSYTWDAAYGVETVVAATQFGWGGPNDTTANNAYGAAVFEIWETTNLLAGTLYDPSTAASKATSSALAMTALDTTNLRHTFTAPASGNVVVRLRAPITGSTSTGLAVQLGVLDGATVKARAPGMGGYTQAGTIVATDHFVVETLIPVTGLTPTTSYTWDAAYGCESAILSTVLNYGGPNNTTGNDAWGGFAYEIWSA